MLTIMIIGTISTVLMITPVFVSIMVLLQSLAGAVIIYKISISSIFSFILILMYSSGMMILFIYVSSMLPKQTKKNSKHIKLIMLLLVPILITSQLQNYKMETMKTFSSQLILLLMASILIMAMVAISLKAFNPLQTVSSTF